MQSVHNVQVNVRYWILIFLISIWGTNTGDFAVHYYHDHLSGFDLIGFKHLGPFPLLAVVFCCVLLLERFVTLPTEVFFWTQILLIRTAATNIADALVDDLEFDINILIGTLTICMVLYAINWQQKRSDKSYGFLPETNGLYWLGMLIAGVLGTVVGDLAWHLFGLAETSLVLTLVYVIGVAVGRHKLLSATPFYWLGVVMARITGTAIGDWLAKSQQKGGAGLGLEWAVVASGIIFILMTLFTNPRLMDSQKNKEIGV
jgi:uncharacterized membrane-anchored protein